MILVTLGTQKQSFKRLLEYIEKSDINEKIIVQAGYTKFVSKKMKIIDFIPYEEMDKLIDKCSLVITHGGTGSILTPLKKGKKVIACARLSKYGEHVDDHQTELVSIFSDEGYIKELNEFNDLDEIIEKLDDFTSKKYASNTNSFIEKLNTNINSNKKNNSILLILLCCLYLFISISLLLFREQKEFSDSENRDLISIDLSLIKDFSKESFQTNLEDGLSDQILLSQTFKLYGKRISNLLSKVTLKTLYNYDKYGIVPATKGLYFISHTDYLVYGFYGLESMENSSRKSLLNINRIVSLYPNIDVSAFKITRETDFKYRSEFDEYARSVLNSNVTYSSFNINSYDDYMKYFYKSDHHWNNVGQYEGYKQIANMLGFVDYVKINSTKCFKEIKFWGSQARMIGNTEIYDEFCVNKYDYPKLEFIKPKNYAPMRSMYDNGNIPTDINTSHYGNYNGFDYGETKIINKYSENDKNILVFSDSYSNPINELIASHYYETYVIDMRNYEAEEGKKFLLNDYLKDKKIDNILFLGNMNFFEMDAFFVEIGE